MLRKNKNGARERTEKVLVFIKRSFLLAFVLLLAALPVAATSCTRNKITKELSSGEYRVKGRQNGAYIRIDSDSAHWQSCQSTLSDFNIKGVYSMKGQTLTLTGSHDSKIVLKRIADDAFTVEKAEYSYEYRPLWLEKGDVFTLYTYEGEMSVFNTVCDTETGLALAEQAGAVIAKKSVIVSGKEALERFLATVKEQKPASLLIAQYYEDPFADAPSLYFSVLEYDGSTYMKTTRSCSERDFDSRVVFPYLLRFQGDTPPGALYAHYDCIALTESPDVTYEQLQRSMFSSSGTDFIPFTFVVTDFHDD